MGMIVAFVLVLSFSELSLAIDDMSSGKKTRAKARQVTGEVTEIDVKAQTVSVRGKKGTVSIGLTEKTKVTMNKEPKMLSDVQVGDRVTVKYKDADGRQTARSIEIKAAPRKPKLPS